MLLTNTAITEEFVQYALYISIINIALALINYVLSAMAIYKVAKVEKFDNPWMAWVPFVNSYLFIKVAGGKIYMVLLAILAFLTGSAATAQVDNPVFTVLGMVISIAWSIYAFGLYSKLADRYNVNVILFLAALLAPVALYVQFISSMYIPLMIVGFFGYYSLYKSASKGPVKGPKVTSKIVYSKKKRK